MTYDLKTLALECDEAAKEPLGHPALLLDVAAALREAAEAQADLAWLLSHGGDGSFAGFLDVEDARRVREMRAKWLPTTGGG